MVKWFNDPFNSYNAKASITWDTAYAQKVHADRPWTERAASTVDIADLINRQSQGSFKENFTKGIEKLGEKCDDILDNSIWSTSNTPQSRGRKRYRNAPTWVTITDSSKLKRSKKIKYTFR